MSLFRPRKVVPNTLEPRFNGLDWLAVNNMFKDCLCQDSAIHEQPFIDFPRLEEFVEDVGDRDVALKNLVGDGADDLAERWADSGKLKKKLEIVRGYLGPAENAVIDRALGGGDPDSPGLPGNMISRDLKGKGKATTRDVDSEDESNDAFSDDERGKTAHRLFAELAGVTDEQHQWWLSSSPSQTVDSNAHTPILNGIEKPYGSTKRSPAGAVFPGLDRLTPASSPVRALPRKRIQGTKRRLELSPPHTPPRPVKRPFTEMLTLSSPFQMSGPLGRSSSSESAAFPIASSSRLPPLPLAHQSPPLLELNNRVFRRVVSSPADMNETPKLSKRQASARVPTLDENTSHGHVQVGGPTDSRPRNAPHSPQIRKPASQQYLNPSPRSNALRKMQHSVQPRLVKSPGKGASRVQSERLRIAERLAKARPDLVIPSYGVKRATLLAREAKHQVRASPGPGGSSKRPLPLLSATKTLLSFETVDDDDGGMDWNRSRELAEALRADIASGRRPMLPALTCAESQSQESGYTI